MDINNRPEEITVNKFRSAILDRVQSRYFLKVNKIQQEIVKAPTLQQLNKLRNNLTIADNLTHEILSILSTIDDDITILAVSQIRTKYNNLINTLFTDYRDECISKLPVSIYLKNLLSSYPQEQETITKKILKVRPPEHPRYLHAYKRASQLINKHFGLTLVSSIKAAILLLEFCVDNNLDPNVFLKCQTESTIHDHQISDFDDLTYDITADFMIIQRFFDLESIEFIYEEIRKAIYSEWDVYIRRSDTRQAR